MPSFVHAANIPASVQPGVLGRQIRAEQPAARSTQLLPPTVPKPQPADSFGETAKKIKFHLNGIILEGNSVYSAETLQHIYQDKLNTTITVAELQEIVQSITNYYRNNGYILSRAVIPPQHVKDGIVRVRILEGYISKATVIGHPKGARDMVQAYGNRIVASQPLQLKNMERYLLLANELPGVQVQAVLDPSKTETAASDLNLATETKTIGAYVSYDNYGTRYIGPQQLTTSASFNSIFRSGDTTSLTYVTTPRSGKSLQYRDINHDTPIGTTGLRLVLDANQSNTNPQFTLQDLLVYGLARNYNASLRYPLIRSRSQTMTIDTTFTYLNSRVNQLGSMLFNDHIRSWRIGGVYDFADRYRGSNNIGLSATRGLLIMGATSNNQSFFTSRYGATSRYLKFNAGASRLQQLFWKFSLYGAVRGQYSFQPLLSSDQFAFGGSIMGRGYDPAEIIGDRGLGATMELRLDTIPGWFHINYVQFYTFYDAGWIWNLRNVQAGIPTKQTANSAGGGIRFSITKYVSGNLMIAQPLSRKVQSLQQIGNGSLPRTFFSVIASV